MNSIIKHRLKALEIEEVKVFFHLQNYVENDKKTKLLTKLFDQTLPMVANENRYGFILNKQEDLEYIKNLFITIGRNDLIVNILIELKNWDFYSYIHTFDVFVIGNLFTKSLDYKSRIEFAKGTLLYDIGKIKIPKEIWEKRAQLTNSQQQLIKNHTNYGRKLVGDQFSNYVKDLILNHHERLDGSGYPNQLIENEIDFSVRLLSIIDVYSSLTLRRVDREPLSATKALECMLCEPNKFDQTLLGKFMEFLHIFPIGSFVALTNNKLVKVIGSQHNAIFIPEVTEIMSKSTFYLPLNLSLSVKRYISWDQEDNALNKWNLFIDYLLSRKKNLAFKIFEELSFELTFDNVYYNIVNPAMKEFEQRGIKTDIIEQLLIKWMHKKFRQPSYVNITAHTEEGLFQY